MKFHKIKFPQDESIHQTTGEWWYFNGNLESANGHQYAYMNTLFRARLPIKNQLLKPLTKKNTYAYHSIITDISDNQFYPHIHYLIRVAPNSFRHSGLNVYFSPTRPISRGEHYFIEQLDHARYRILGKNLNLEMFAEKPPLLENQTGNINFFNRPNFYYSLTSLKTQGSIIVNDQEIRVTGKSWMDHQWFDMPDLSRDGWNWFSIQLDNNVEIMCYEYLYKSQSAYLASVSFADGSQQSFTDFVLTPKDQKWKSPLTKAEYELYWHLEIPKIKINLEIKPRVTNHEMNFFIINYWESPIEVEGTLAGKRVKGLGYMELAGRRSIFNDLSFLKEKVLEKISSAHH